MVAYSRSPKLELCQGRISLLLDLQKLPVWLLQNYSDIHYTLISVNLNSIDLAHGYHLENIWMHSWDSPNELLCVGESLYRRISSRS